MKGNTRILATIVSVRTRAIARRGFLLCALLFSLAIVAPARSANADQPIPVAVLDTFNKISTPAPGFTVSFVGVFTSIIGSDDIGVANDDVVTGTSRMDVLIVGDIAYCKFTWVSSVGTLVVRSVCVFSSGHGTWHVESGTGRYKHFKAVGTQTFGRLPSGGPFTNYERFAGITTNDEHGDNE